MSKISRLLIDESYILTLTTSIPCGTERLTFVFKLYEEMSEVEKDVSTYFSYYFRHREYVVLCCKSIAWTLLKVVFDLII